MRTQANYFKIGLFVILTVAIGIAGIIALSARALIRDTVLLETYMDESVLGLNVGSPVMQRGVQIGSVKKITFVPQEYGDSLSELTDTAFSRYNRYVLIVAEIQRATLVELPGTDDMAEVIERSVANGLRLKLSPQGITGIYYLEADYFDPARYPRMQTPWTAKRYYIPAAPSTLTSFTQSADQILQKLKDVDLKRISESLDGALVAIQEMAAQAEVGKTRKEVAQVLAAIQLAVEDANVAPLRADLGRLVQSVRQTNALVMEILGERREPEDKTVRQTITQLHDALSRIERLLTGAEPDLENIVQDLQRAADNFRQTTERVRANPARLFMGADPPKTKVTR